MKALEISFFVCFASNENNGKALSSLKFYSARSGSSGCPDSYRRNKAEIAPRERRIKGRLGTRLKREVKRGLSERRRSESSEDSESDTHSCDLIMKHVRGSSVAEPKEVSVVSNGQFRQIIEISSPSSAVQVTLVSVGS